MVVLGAGTAAAGCRRESPPPAEQQVSGPVVLLRGVFVSVAKTAQGHAEIVRDGERFELRLRGVTIESKRPVRVYLVGAERASTTRSVFEARLQYDMAELEVGADPQIIALPSEPDPSLRSVVLWEPTFYVNLAYAPLTPPGDPSPP